MSRRHLRIHYFDDYAQPIDTAPVLSVVMPAMWMPIERPRIAARECCGLSHNLRRVIVARMALHEARRRKPTFWGVMLMVCPDSRHVAHRSARARTPGLRAHLTPGNAFLASYAAVSPLGKIVVGDVMTATFREAMRETTEAVRHILMRKPGERDKRLAKRRARSTSESGE